MATRQGKVVVIIPAAGSGKRVGQGIPKQFLEIRGKPLFIYTLEKFDLCPVVDEVILAVQANDIEKVNETVAEWNIRKVRDVVAGGVERHDSVEKGLDVLSEDVGIVTVHDAVRPFVSVQKISEVVKTAGDFGAAILAIPAKDTIKSVNEGWVERTLNRDPLWCVQTPQAFRVEWIMEGYAKAKQEGYKTSDDAALVERLGYRVKIVEGEEKNIKITSPEDILIAKIFIEEEER